MIEKLLSEMHHAEETLRRSITKTISYRVVILILDFISLPRNIIIIQKCTDKKIDECGLNID